LDSGESGEGKRERGEETRGAGGCGAFHAHYATRVGEEAGIIVQQEDPENGRRQKYASAHDLRRGCAQRLINVGVSAETLNQARTTS